MKSATVGLANRSSVRLAPNSTRPDIEHRPQTASGWSSFGLFQCSFLAMLIASLIGVSESIPCSEARTKCAYRTGCGYSLHSYMVECSSLIAGQTDRCHARCENALVALVSSEEGEDLVKCDCEGSKYCEQAKQRIEVCRPAVFAATAKDTIVSCTTARWICMADALCRTALEYYHIFCRGLFHGNKCTNRCKNSLSILERQEKAAKLRTCYCEGNEEFPCKKVKYNTERYCYQRVPPGLEPYDTDNQIEVIGSNALHHKRHKSKHRNEEASAGTLRHHLSLLTLALLNLAALALSNRYHCSPL